jgi:hypothetical protein
MGVVLESLKGFAHNQDSAQNNLFSLALLTPTSPKPPEFASKAVRGELLG